MSRDDAWQELKAGVQTYALPTKRQPNLASLILFESERGYESNGWMGMRAILMKFLSLQRVICQCRLMGEEGEGTRAARCLASIVK